MSESVAPTNPRSADGMRKKSARELGASLVLAIHRLIKVAQLHALDNMAVLQQLDQTSEAIRIFCARVGDPAAFLFAKNTVFVSGQLLKASRTEYDAALELGAMLQAVGVTELVIQPNVDSDDLKRFAGVVVSALRDRDGRLMPRQPTPRIRVRRVDAAALLADEEDLPHDEQIVRTYAQAIVVMRRVLETLGQGRLELPQEAKRIAQKLVMLSEGDTPSFLGVTAMRNANHDIAGRAVNTSILAVAMCRLLTDDLAMLARIAMAALFHDVGHAYLARGTTALSDDEDARMPAVVAFVQTLLGGFRLPSMVRTVIDFESHWHARSALLGAPYAGEEPISVAARIVATAHRFNALLTPDPASRKLLTPDEAIAVIRSEAQDPDDGQVLSLLIGAIGLFPSGTIVELSSGERGVVVKTPSHPAEYVRPLVRIVYRANGTPLESPRDLDLRDDPSRLVASIVSSPDQRLRACRQQVLAETPQPTVPARAQRRTAPPTAPPPTPRTIGADSEPPKTAPAVVPTRIPSTRPDLPAAKNSEGPPARVYSSSIPPSISAIRPRGVRISTMPSMPAVRLERRPEREPRVAITELSPPPHQDGVRAEPKAPPPEPPSAAERGPSSISSVFSLITQNVTATARGTLGRTPLAHLIVYVLERRLTGTLVLTPTDESGLQHGVYFDRGVATRVWTPAGVAPLGRMLSELGHLDAVTLADPLLSIVVDHEPALEAELLRNAFVSDSQIAEARGRQLRRGIEFLFTLRATTEYSFFADTDLVEGHVGSICGYVAPLELLVLGARRRGEDAIMTRVLARLGEEPLTLAPGLRADSFGFDLDEASAFEALALGSPSLPELLQNPLVDSTALRRVVYVLLLTRSLIAGDPASDRTPIENPLSSR